MADTLLPYIYHEDQQPGSMMCGQHALNSLLQGHYFTAEDLSNIAQTLDTLENEVDVDNSGRASSNVDETGYFSVQVLERALQVWNLSLVNWRSAELRSVNAHPENQVAFILNLASHWLTLRRFGPSPGYWYNLNSFAKPTWVSTTYLGMFLNEAEMEGYSVFAVRPLDPAQPNMLPACEADDIADSIFSGEQSLYGGALAGGPGAVDDDAELQAAIAASLSSNGQSTWEGPSSTVNEPPTVDMPDMDTLLSFSGARHRPTPPDNGGPPSLVQKSASAPSRAGPSRRIDMDTEIDDAQLAESMARSTAALQRFRMSSEENTPQAAEGSGNGSRKRSGMSAGGDGRTEPKRRRTTGEEEEEEIMRRAMAASMEGGAEEGEYRVDDDEEELDMDAEDGDFDLGSYPASMRPLGGAAVPGRADPRVLDDEDAMLQAALKASLEDNTADELIVPAPRSVPRSRGSVEDVAAVGGQPPPAQQEAPQAQVEEAQEEEEEEAPPTVEEMRRRRLARFGG